MWKNIITAPGKGWHFAAKLSVTIFRENNYLAEGAADTTKAPSRAL